MLSYTPFVHPTRKQHQGEDERVPPLRLFDLLLEEKDRRVEHGPGNWSTGTNSAFWEVPSFYTVHAIHWLLSYAVCDIFPSYYRELSAIHHCVAFRSSISLPTARACSNSTHIPGSTLTKAHANVNDALLPLKIFAKALSYSFSLGQDCGDVYGLYRSSC